MTRIGAGVGTPALGEPLPVELMNTVWADRDGVHDDLAGTAAALAWLRSVADRIADGVPALGAWLGSARPEGADDTADRLRSLRGALRALAAEATTDPRAPAADRGAALAVLNAACAGAPVWPELRWPPGGPPARAVCAPDPPGRVAVALIAGAGVDLLAGPDRELLRPCLAPGCVQYFVRRRPRREWCSPACGNRARVARHYRRTRAPA
ncbi:CGNR zinc finger domain-containing protein, partial [Nocardiopsis trehalosi]|uniref:CGNR zinc finger domain-containing protein n=1 Tax=Nocardiopsis trehalosi TaxID=109329 RepID=UPI00082C117C